MIGMSIIAETCLFVYVGVVSVRPCQYLTSDPSYLVNDRNVSQWHYELSSLALNKFASHQQPRPQFSVKCKVISSIRNKNAPPYIALASIYLFKQFTIQLENFTNNYHCRSYNFDQSKK